MTTQTIKPTPRKCYLISIIDKRNPDKPVNIVVLEDDNSDYPNAAAQELLDDYKDNQHPMHEKDLDVTVEELELY